MLKVSEDYPTRYSLGKQDVRGLYEKRRVYEIGKTAGVIAGLAEYPQIEACDIIRISEDWSVSSLVAWILQWEVKG